MFRRNTQQWAGLSIGVFLWLMCLPLAAAQPIALQRMFAEVALQRPLAMLPAVQVANTWYVVEQAGRVLRLTLQKGKWSSRVFADLRDRVDAGSNEAGLLGMAFDPAFAQNGHVYFSYTGEGSPLTSILSRFVSRDGGQSVEPGSEQILLRVAQPYNNHNGGNILFGPDGYLYFGLGDGGSAGDPKGHGQNTRTLLGSLLRLDVRGDVDGKGGYRIPSDNPFVTGGGRPEIFAYGLRNPWRWSFDRDSGELWLADVGQNAWEEINTISRGGNYGWNLREGAHCYSGDCKRAGLIEPVAEYSQQHGCSVTGGYVYRGRAMPTLRGVYLYGDFCSGNIWALKATAEGDYVSDLLLETSLNIASFAEGGDGEIYVIDLGGKIFRLVSPP